MIVTSNIPNFSNDLMDEAKLFFNINSYVNISHIYTFNGFLVNSFTITMGENTYQKEFKYDINLNSLNDLNKKRLVNRYAKLSLYIFLSEITGIEIEWGSLTGVRPTRLAYSNIDNYKHVLKETFKVSDKKINLISQILDNQRGIYNKDEKDVDLYIGIPFCPTRCSYCSFSSGELSTYLKYVKPYVEALSKEIKASIELIRSKGLNLRAIYFGGGTPTTLNPEDLEKLLFLLKDLEPKELTIEAGRPDTITKEKLDLFSKYGVTRISINPQSFNQNTLDLIGRKHLVSDIDTTFALARNYDFIINMDLICGLPDESLDDFKYSLDKALKLNPDNMTIHSLALKGGSKLKNEEYEIDKSSLVKSMIDYSYKTLINSGFAPYYLYRQKYMSDNQENVGYHRNNTQCIYNIDIMEETTSIIACGAGAISKRVYLEKEQIDRVANIKDIILYINQIDKEIENKKRLFI